jgi:hypothetical protein
VEEEDTLEVTLYLYECSISFFLTSSIQVVEVLMEEQQEEDPVIHPDFMPITRVDIRPEMGVLP